MINQKAMARVVNKVKPRILQIHRTVSDKSVVQLDNTRGVKPERSDIRPAI